MFQLSRSIGRRWMSSSLDCGIVKKWGEQRLRRNYAFNVHNALQSRGFAHDVRPPFQDPDMRNCRTIEETTQMAYDHVESLSPRGMAAFWSLISKFLLKGNRGYYVKSTNTHHGQMQQQIMAQQLEKILFRTFDNIEAFNCEYLARITFSFARIVKNVGNPAKRPPKGIHHQILHSLLIGNNSSEKNHRILFRHIASASIPILPEFDSRYLSNLIYAYGLAECVPTFDDGSTYFDLLAIEAIPNLEKFNAQDLSNMLWSYAKVGASNPPLFQEVGDIIGARNNLDEFNSQALSNTAWAYATAEESHPQLFNKISDRIVSLNTLGEFTSQGFSNIAWAYATADESQPKLFKKIADHIIALHNLDEFYPQQLSNIVWAYATAKESHPKLFKKIADHIIVLGNVARFQEVGDIIGSARNNLDEFNPQHLSNIAWAYATADEVHPRLFKKIADHIIALHNLDEFDPRALSNIVWAYATAKESHPKLFEKLAGHIIALDNLSEFEPQHLSNIAWAYATAMESHPKLFEKLADSAIKSQNEFNSQNIANYLWACATNAHIDQHVFSSFAPFVKTHIGECNPQFLSNIGWAYAVANVAAPSLFNDEFINACLKHEDEFKIKQLSQLHQWHLWQEEFNACLEKEDEFVLEDLSQFHQWQLWQDELKSNIRLPPSLQEKCYEAFISRVPSPSALQNDVISELTSIGLQPEEEVLTEIGYRLDALVEVSGKKIGIEVDGPHHFLGRKPTGSTILKHRQVTNLDRIPVVSVPYWEWNKLRKDSGKKQQYLRSLLDLR